MIWTDFALSVLCVVGLFSVSLAGILSNGGLGNIIRNLSARSADEVGGTSAVNAYNAVVRRDSGLEVFCGQLFMWLVIFGVFYSSGNA